MGTMSVWHWLILGIVVMLLFGKGRISDIMGDAAKGIKAFKKGMAEEEHPPITPPRQVAQDSVVTAPGTANETVTRS